MASAPTVSHSKFVILHNLPPHPNQNRSKLISSINLERAQMSNQSTRAKAAVKSSRPIRDDPEQSRLFLNKAREIAADEKHSAADKLMERLAKTPPQPKTKSDGMAANFAKLPDLLHRQKPLELHLLDVALYMGMSLARCDFQAAIRSLARRILSRLTTRPVRPSLP